MSEAVVMVKVSAILFDPYYWDSEGLSFSYPRHKLFFFLIIIIIYYYFFIFCHVGRQCLCFGEGDWTRTVSCK